MATGTPDPGRPALGRRALAGLLMLLAQNAVARLSGLLSQLLLALLLVPADFGVIGLTYSVSNVAASLLNVGLDDVVLQRHTRMRLWTGPAFWMSLSLALLAAALVVLVSPLAAILYRSHLLIGLLAVLAIAMPVNALAAVPTMLMRARMQFRVIAIYGAIEIVAMAALTVLLAWAGFGAYSFAIPAPLAAIARATVFWRLAPVSVSLRPHWRRWKYLLGNTGAAFASRVIIAVIGQGDYVVLGILDTHHVVGIYYFGFRLAAQPLWMLAGNVASVLFPALVQLKSDAVRQAQTALRASKLLAFCVMPLAFLQAALAAPLIPFCFGQKWAASIPIIQLLSVGLALDAVGWVAGALLGARGEFSAGLRFCIAQLPLFFPLVWIGALAHGAVGVAVAVCAFYAVTQPVFVWSVYRPVGITFSQIAAIYLRPICLAAIATGAGLLLASPSGLAASPLARAVLIAAGASLTYGALVRLFAPDVWIELIRRVRGVLPRAIA
jgi:PST family polysaccharide transporter